MGFDEPLCLASLLRNPDEMWWQSLESRDLKLLGCISASCEVVVVVVIGSPVATL